MALTVAIICILIFAGGVTWLAIGGLMWMADCIEAERNGEI